MSWEKSLLEPTLNGVACEIVEIDDDFSWAVAEHAYPYVNGSDVEPMGRNARRIPVKLVFYGADYEVRLEEFLKALDAGVSEFIHPVFGAIKVTALNCGIHHEADNVDEARLSLVLIESTPGNPFFETQRGAALAAENIAAKSKIVKTVAADKYGSLIDKMRAASPMAALQKLRAAITGPILAAMDFANVVLANLDPLAYPRFWANDFQSLINGALDIKNWGAMVVSEWASIQATFSSLDIFISPSSGAQPEAVSTSSATAATEAQAIAVTQATVDVFRTAALADAVALAFTAIADAQAVNSTTASTQPTEASEATPNEIEEMANTVRACIESTIKHCQAVYAMEDSRAITEPLKDLALSIQDTASALIEARPPLVRRTVTAPANMRLLAHHLYQDCDRARELWRLNGARSPFVETGETINAYAK